MAKINKERNYQRNISDILMLRISLTVKYTVKLFHLYILVVNIYEVFVVPIIYSYNFKKYSYN